MVRGEELRLPEEITLLALHDRKGTVLWSTFYRQALGGAVLAELILTGRLGVEAQGKKRFAVVADSRPTGDEVLDEALAKVAGARRRAQLKAWVQRFAGLKRLRHRVAQGLCRRGILRETEDRILLLFRRRVYPEVDPRPERGLRERLRRAIEAPQRAEPRTLVLLALAYHARLLGGVMPKSELKRRRKKIEAAIAEDAVGKATSEAIKAAQAAAAMVAINPAIG